MNRPLLVRWALGLALLILIVVNVIVRVDRGAVDNGSAARAVAQQATIDFFSLSYKNPASDVDAVLALSTGSFRKQYAAQRKQIIAGVTKTQLVVTANVPSQGAALEYLHGGTARVLVAVNVTSRSTSGASNNRYRTRVTLQRTNGTWLVSGLDQVG